MKAYLQITGPEQSAYYYPLEEGRPIRIGRSPENELCLLDARVSSRHAMIFADRGRWVLLDNHSRNGTYVNGVMIHEIPLQDEQIIQMGALQITFHLGAAPGALPMARHPSEANAGDAPLAMPTLSMPALEPAVQGAKPCMKTVEGDLEEPDGTKLLSGAGGGGWVEGCAREILADMAASRDFSAQAIYQKVMYRLLNIIGAENGVFLIEDPAAANWVAGAWIGDAQKWSDYEKQHPMPYSVAQRAIEENRIISNTLDPNNPTMNPSDSQRMMHVNTYIAVPINQAGKRALFYFDTRRGEKFFAERDARLIETIGAHLLQLRGR